MIKNAAANSRSYVRWLADIHLVCFTPAFTLFLLIVNVLPSADRQTNVIATALCAVTIYNSSLKKRIIRTELSAFLFNLNVYLYGLEIYS